MPMTPFELRNAIPHTEVEAGVRRGRQLRAEAVRDVIGRMFRHSVLDKGDSRAHGRRVPAPC
jgi:hypothetical protein